MSTQSSLQALSKQVLERDTRASNIPSASGYGEGKGKGPENMRDLQYSYLDFHGIAEIFQELTSTYRLEDPFSSGEIVVFVDKLPESATDYDFLSKSADLMAIKGNKPMNVILALWLSKQGTQPKTKPRFDEAFPFFDFKLGTQRTEETYRLNCKVMLFSFMLLLTRGSIPEIGNSAGGNPLPKLLMDNVGANYATTESQFAELFASFNIRKINFSDFLSIPIAKFPDPIKNRIMKGTAGSRVLKLVLMSAKYGPIELESLKKYQGHYDTIKSLAGESTCYLSLHPMRQTVQAQIPSFYTAMLWLIACVVGESNWSAFFNETQTVKTFTNDNRLKSVVFGEGLPLIDSRLYFESFDAITPKGIEQLFGKSLQS